MSFEAVNTSASTEGEIHPLDAEHFLLLDIQKAHAETLDVSGITDKALEAIRYSDDKKSGGVSPSRLSDAEAFETNPLTRVYVMRTTRHKGKAKECTSLCVGFELKERDEATGVHEIRTRAVPVAQGFGDIYLPRGPFDQADLEVVQEMVEGLEFARQNGILPHLGYELSGIFDQRTAMGMLQQTK